MSSSSKLISHPHQPLWKHLQGLDVLSSLVLQAKYLKPGFAAKEDLELWRRLLVYFHDFGKATAYFQYRIIEAAKKENPTLSGLDIDYIDRFCNSPRWQKIQSQLQQTPELGRHAEIGAVLVQSSIQTNDPLLRGLLLEMIKRHHGDLHDFIVDEFFPVHGQEDLLIRQWEHLDRLEYGHILSMAGFIMPTEWEALHKSYYSPRFARRLVEDNLPAVDLRPYLLTLFLFSLLLSADKGDLMLDDESRNQVGKQQLFRVDTVAQYKSAVFAGQESKPIDQTREAAYQLVEQHVRKYPDAPFYSITLPTGLGKTLTAFNAAFTLQNLIAERKGYVPKIIYCLPFTSVIDQNAAILEDILKVAGMKDGYLARHHYLSDWINSKGDLNELSDSEKEYFTEGWEYSFIVTTFVQLLETLFSNRNRKLRKFHNITNAIIILDEVQNIEAKYFETVEAMFQAMHDYFDTRFVFVTATQPFLIKGRDVVELTDPAKERTKRFFTNMDRIQLDISLWKRGKLLLEELLPHFQQAIEAERNKSFLFILNKVKASQDLYNLLKEQNPKAEMVYLSAAILPILRKERIEKIKQYKSDKQLIVVSTQVVEAGVDIDLDIVYRDFAPLDSINQSAGRCNRNGLKGRGEVRLFEMEKGWTKIYDDVLIHATRKVIEQASTYLKSDIIPEKEFYALNEAYALQVRERVADNSAHSELIEDMKKLHFATVEKKFKVIEQEWVKHSVFIDFDECSANVWNRYQTIYQTIKDRWERKKALRKLRPEILQFVVQFPDYVLPEEYKNKDKAIIYLGPDEYKTCYDLETGYKKEAEQPMHAAQQC